MHDIYWAEEKNKVDNTIQKKTRKTFISVNSVSVDNNFKNCVFTDLNKNVITTVFMVWDKFL